MTGTTWLPKPMQPSRPPTHFTSDSTDMSKPPEIPYIDWEALQARFPGKQAFVERLLRTLVVSDEQTPGRIRAAVHAGDFDAARKLAHSIKGMAGTIMAADLMSQAADAECHAAENLPDADVRLIELAGAVDTLIAGLKAHLDRTPAA
jgi:HPt (histidine-containing phosphotransfer) domain-containing protein